MSDVVGAATEASGVAVTAAALATLATGLGLGFAGGAMTWMVLAQILPDALRPSQVGRKGSSVPLT